MANDDRVLAESYLHGRRGAVVQLKPGESIPDGATLINDSVVAQMKQSVLVNLPLSQSWAYKYGTYIVLGTSWLSGGLVAYTLRWKLKMFGVAGRFLTYGPAVFGPSVIAGLIQDVFKQQALQGEQECPVCLPIKSACMNTVSGWLIPSAIGAMTAAHLARVHNTYPVPRLNEPKALIQLLSKLSYRYRPLYGALFCVSFITPFVTTYMQGVEIRNVVLEKTLSLEDRITTKSSNWGHRTGVS